MVLYVFVINRLDTSATFPKPIAAYAEEVEQPLREVCQNIATASDGEARFATLGARGDFQFTLGNHPNDTLTRSIALGKLSLPDVVGLQRFFPDGPSQHLSIVFSPSTGLLAQRFTTVDQYTADGYTHLKIDSSKSRLAAFCDRTVLIGGTSLAVAARIAAPSQEGDPAENHIESTGKVTGTYRLPIPHSYEYPGFFDLDRLTQVYSDLTTTDS